MLQFDQAKMPVTEKLLDCPVCFRAFGVQQNDHVAYVTNGAEISDIIKPELISFCPECAVGIAFPKLTDEQIDSLYTRGDFWKDHTTRVFLPKNDPGQYVLAEARWQFIEKYIQSQKEWAANELSVLDIGGGHGFLGMAASESKYVKLKKMYIVEKDKFFIKSSKLTWEEKFAHVHFCIEDAIENIPRSETFDLVILSHILEHLNDPKKMILSASNKIRSGGFLFIDLPYRDYLFKKDIFPHVLFFNEKSIRKLLEDVDLEIKMIKRFGRSNENLPLRFVEKIIYKFRSFIPIGISKIFFDWHLGANREDPNGMWIRILARKL